MLSQLVAQCLHEEDRFPRIDATAMYQHTCRFVDNDDCAVAVTKTELNSKIIQNLSAQGPLNCPFFSEEVPYITAPLSPFYQRLKCIASPTQRWCFFQCITGTHGFSMSSPNTAELPRNYVLNMPTQGRAND